MSTIQILHFSGCPHLEPTRRLVQEVTSRFDPPARIELIEIHDEREARRHRFLGSPSVRVNGADVEPEAAGREDFHFGCRLYRGSGVPPREWIESALGLGGDAS